MTQESTDRLPQGHTELLENAVQDLPPGSDLDVTGFDVSKQGLLRAAEAAARRGVTVRAVRSTAESFDYGTERWDLLVLCYAWAPIYDPAFAARLQASLRPGGWIVFEHFLHAGPGAPPASAGAPDPGQLPRLFAGFDIVSYEEVVRLADWLPLGERTVRPLARMLARKPA